MPFNQDEQQLYYIDVTTFPGFCAPDTALIIPQSSLFPEETQLQDLLNICFRQPIPTHESR